MTPERAAEIVAKCYNESRPVCKDTNGAQLFDDRLADIVFEEFVVYLCDTQTTWDGSELPPSEFFKKSLIHRNLKTMVWKLVNR